MARLHYCTNGVSVTDQVLIYLDTKANSDYIPIQQYYDDYKTHWHKQLADFMDRATFDAEFDYRLCRAILKFKVNKAQRLAKKNNWSTLGMFNRWFYRCLIHWSLNVKTSFYRSKKRPSVCCPICGKLVTKITEEHLAHFKSVKELPSVFVWEGKIYETISNPAKYAVCWGVYDRKKFANLENHMFRLYKKKRVRWPWKLKDGKKGVVCPFTKNIVPKINSDYIKTLDNKYSRYAVPVSWADFTEQHPMVLIQAEIYSLDYDYDHRKNDSVLLKDSLPAKNLVEDVDLQSIKENISTSKYEHTFKIIDDFIEDNTSRDILKLASIGYTTEDIASTLNITKRNVRNSLALLRNIPDIKEKLLYN